MITEAAECFETRQGGGGGGERVLNRVENLTWLFIHTGPFNRFRSIHKELLTARRLNFRTVKVVSYEPNTCAYKLPKNSAASAL